MKYIQIGAQEFEPPSLSLPCSVCLTLSFLACGLAMLRFLNSATPSPLLKISSSKSSACCCSLPTRASFQFQAGCTATLFPVSSAVPSLGSLWCGKCCACRKKMTSAHSGLALWEQHPAPLSPSPWPGNVFYSYGFLHVALYHKFLFQVFKLAIRYGFPRKVLSDFLLKMPCPFCVYGWKCGHSMFAFDWL